MSDTLPFSLLYIARYILCYWCQTFIVLIQVCILYGCCFPLKMQIFTFCQYYKFLFSSLYIYTFVPKCVSICYFPSVINKNIYIYIYIYIYIGYILAFKPAFSCSLLCLPFWDKLFHLFRLSSQLIHFITIGCHEEKDIYLGWGGLCPASPDQSLWVYITLGNRQKQSLQSMDYDQKGIFCWGLYVWPDWPA